MIILNTICRNADVVKALTVQKSGYAVAAIKVMFSAVFLAVKFTCMVVNMIIFAAIRGGALPVLAYAILPAIDFNRTLIIVFTAVLNRIRLTVSLIHMLIIRAFDGLAFAGLTCFVCIAGLISCAVRICPAEFIRIHRVDACTIANHLIWRGAGNVS
jgi:hypothetical protein